MPAEQRLGTAIAERQGSLANQEQLFTRTIAMIVHGNDAVHQNGTHRKIHEALQTGLISGLDSLRDFISEAVTLKDDDRNGLGRQIFYAVKSAKSELYRAVDPAIIDEQFPKFLAETFGKGRLARWQRESVI